jgi:hypothetical protein
MTLRRVHRRTKLGLEGHHDAPPRTCRGQRKVKREAGSSPRLTKACKRRPPASARASFPLPAAAEAQRCYDFQCPEWVATFLGLHGVFCPRCIRRAGASKTRRLILLLSVDWVPPYLPPSGACLALGTRMREGSLNAVEDYTIPGLRLFRCTLGNLLSSSFDRDPSGAYDVTGICLAMAHMNPINSRAIATTTWLACLPRALSRRYRLHSLTWAFQLMSWMILGWFSSRRWRWRLTFAG